MARARRKSAATTSAIKSTDELKCPECGKTFTRAASLGAHRNRAHGIAGASKKATGRRSPQRSRAAAASRSQGSPVDRNQLLEKIFPNGVPPREEVIRRASNWLDEAERLASL